MTQPLARSSRALILGVIFGLGVAGRPAKADVPVTRSVYRLPSSNGHGAVLVDLNAARLTHFREHPFASEEPLIDASGNDVWSGNQPQSVATRDLLFDAYFGLRSEGSERWLTTAPVDRDHSGYAGYADGKVGGTGIASLVQTQGALELTQYFFAPRDFPHAGFVMAMRARNTGPSKLEGLAAFSLHNFHLGYGRPGPLADLAANGETIDFDPAKQALVERGFAGVVVARPLGAVLRHAATTPGSNKGIYDIVAAGGNADLENLDGPGVTADDSVSGYELELGALDPGAEAWVGVAFAHKADPFAASEVEGWLDAFLQGRDAKSVVEGERASWAKFQASLTPPAGLSTDEETLLRHSAAMLAMAQVRESSSYLREFLSKDGEPRYTRFGTSKGGPKASLPATVEHRGKGAVLASLPPGEWTVAWARDGAYAAAAMASLGMNDEARAALEFTLGAEADRFQTWSELASYAMPPYLVSLVRYHGFGIEETDLNDFGPNLEFDGLGLFLWALRTYEMRSGDTSLVDANWNAVSAKVADVLVALVDPATGLIRPDSSIWETHWKGRERTWAFTSITAARGLCDAAALAERMGDAAHAQTYREAGTSLRSAIAHRLTDDAGSIAANTEELASGEGYWDAAVLDAIALGLFDPKGRIAKATLAGLDAHLAAPAGAGWSRNDDRRDHMGGVDLSPWGSEYDSAEWVFTDLRGAIATRRGGDMTRADRLLAWVRDQSLANYLEVSETYDEGNGTYKFNAPMVGFGAGAYALALVDRGEAPEPACGAYFDEGARDGGFDASAEDAGLNDAPSTRGGCGCAVPSRDGEGTLSTALALGLGGIGLRRRMRRRA